MPRVRIYREILTWPSTIHRCHGLNRLIAGAEFVLSVDTDQAFGQTLDRTGQALRPLVTRCEGAIAYNDYRLLWGRASCFPRRFSCQLLAIFFFSLLSNCRVLLFLTLPGPYCFILRPCVLNPIENAHGKLEFVLTSEKFAMHIELKLHYFLFVIVILKTSL